MTLEGLSRQAWAGTLDALSEVEANTSVDLREVASQIYSVSETLAGNSHLCQALGDKSRDAWPKRELADHLFASRIGAPALQIVEAAVSGRWRVYRDLHHVLERCGHDLILFAAQREGNLDQVERELLAVTDLFSTNLKISDALHRVEGTRADKQKLIERLLAGKVLADTLVLATRPVVNSRGRRYSAVIWTILSLAARRRDKMTALVTSARPLTDAQEQRLTSGLSAFYGRPIFVNTQVDPSLVGGMRVRVGDEVIDGSIQRRLAQVGRSLDAI